MKTAKILVYGNIVLSV